MRHTHDLLAVVCCLGLLISEVEFVNATPSFDCGQARNAAEKTICSSDELSDLDQKMSEYFSEIRKNLPRSQYLQEARGFLERRDKCGVNVECIASMYKKRIRDIRLQIGSVAPYEGTWFVDEVTKLEISQIGGGFFKVEAYSESFGPNYCKWGPRGVYNFSGTFYKGDIDGYLISVADENSPECGLEIRVSGAGLDVYEVGDACGGIGVSPNGFYTLDGDAIKVRPECK